jgi:hypothetical protein
MLTKPGLLVFFLFVSLSGIAQNTIIRGKIIDKETKEPVIAATVTAKDSKGAICNAEGEFEIRINRIPATLTISHVSYGRQHVEVDRVSDKLVIRLESLVNRIPEVRISGKKVQALNRRARFSVSDYQLDGKYMWFIGFLENSPKKGKLFFSNHYGDTITTLPISGKEKLYKDLLGTIHLDRGDSIFQLYGKEDSLMLLYPEKKSDFMGVMKAFEVSFDIGLARLNYDHHVDELSLVYIDSTLKAPKRFFLDRDQDRVENYLESKYAWIGRYFGTRTLDLVIRQQRGYYYEVMRSFCFTLHDTLYAVNLKDNQLHAFGPGLEEKYVIPISFHLRATDDIGNVFMAFDIITDPVLHKPYVLFHLNNKWSLYPFDVNTGKIGTEIDLPNKFGIRNITIYGNTIYFIYPEKLYPYYERLYRMPIPGSGIRNP